MLSYFRDHFEKKRTEEYEIAQRNKREIIAKMEAYYTAVQNGEIDFHPRYLAVQDFWNAKRSGRLDRLNRIKSRKTND